MLRLNVPIERRTIEVGGAQVSVLLAGEPSAAPPVLAVHGFGSSAQYSWQTTGHLIGLARAGRYVIAPDLLGHGLSAKPTDPADYTLDGLAALTAAALFEFAERGPADLLGYSLGARICWQLLTGGPGSTDARWRRAVLGGYDGRPLFEAVDEPALRRSLGESNYSTGDAGDAKSVASSQLSHATQRIADIARAVPGNSLPALLAVVRGLSGTQPSSGTPAVPVLLVAGTDDPIATGAARVAAAVPSAEFLPVPGRDHISAVPASVFRKGAVEFLGR
ncbi:MAG: alpha/beta hydrolase [Actinomycetota bacterium]|nr:alpha/beta hydrolase [Actinomycetota bacterium]